MKNILKKIITIVHEPKNVTYLGLFEFKDSICPEGWMHFIVIHKLKYENEGNCVRPYFGVEINFSYVDSKFYSIPIWFWRKNYEKAIEIDTEYQKQINELHLK